MAQFIFTDNANTTLATGIGSSTTTIVLAPGTGNKFPSPAAGQQFAMTLNDAATKLVFEVVYVTARSGDTCTVVRGQEGTTAVSWAIGDYIFHGPTAGTQAAFGQTAAANTWSGANSFSQPVVGVGATSYNQLIRIDQLYGWNKRVISSSYTVVPTDAGQFLSVYNSSSPSTIYTITLPAASTMAGLGVRFNIGNFAANFVASSGIFYGFSYNAASFMAPYQTVLTLQSDGLNWTIITQVPSEYSWDISSPPVDIPLIIGAKARISFNSTINIPLSIQAVPSGLYRLTGVFPYNSSTNTDLNFYPNNSAYSSAFISFSTEAADLSLTGLGTSTALPTITAYTVPGYVGNLPIVNRYVSNSFSIDLFNGPNSSDTYNDRGPFMLEMLISTATGAKMIRYAGGIQGGVSSGYAIWQDGVTPWTSLGTIGVGFTTSGVSGTMLVERIL